MPLCVTLTFTIGLMSALNIDILTNQDFVWGFGLVVNGLMFISMVVYVGAAKFRAVLVNDFGLDDWKLSKTWEWVIKFVAPIEAVALIVWWAIDLINAESAEGEKWYDFGRETFMVTIIQWLALLVLLVAINMVVVFCILRRRGGETTTLLEKYDTLTASDTVERRQLRNGQSIEIKM
ncbi:unnamed protein product [Candidula unifasciata]|uniref:Uncharacterized protein n=1 Tax=Candidula unifasciata TaxID=100452 RepID=A0A8S3Z9E9_9EUPU|nr:unnamed protein product [Candidula unifasciata]